MNPRLRAQLDRIRSDLSETRAAIPEAEREVQAARDAFGQKEDLQDNARVTETQEFKDVQAAVQRLGELRDKKADLEKQDQDITAAFGGEVARRGDTSRSAEREPAQMNTWDGRALLSESDTYRHAREVGAFTSDAKFGTIVIGQVADRDAAVSFIASGGIRADALPPAPAGPYTTPTAGIPPDFRGIIPYRVRPLTLLDLIPTGTTDSNVVEYVQVSAIPSGAQEVEELATKPELGFETEDATAPVRTIAGWIKMSRQSLDDQAGVATIINNLLPYEVRRRLEAQILAGDGAGQNLRGILNTSGIGAPVAVAGDNAADAVLRAMTVIILSDRDPNFVAMNPITRQGLLLLREGAADGSWKGEYLYGPPGTLAAPTIWGLTITPSRIVDQFAPLVGDSNGATILVREGVNIKTSDSDQDDFVKNRVTILAETRVAFPVWYPTAFAEAEIPH